MELFVSIVWCLLWAATLVQTIRIIVRMWWMSSIVQSPKPENWSFKIHEVSTLLIASCAAGWAVIIVFWFN